MIQVHEIVDRKSFQAWLNQRPEATRQQDAVILASRLALRVLPLWCAGLRRNSAVKRDLTALPVLRCNLISGVAGNAPTPEMNAASVSAAFSADAAVSAAFSADAAASAAFSADAAASAASASAFAATDTDTDAAAAAAATDASAASASAAFSAASATDAAAATAAFSAAEIWAILQRDAAEISNGITLQTRALWPGGTPSELNSLWDQSQGWLTQNPGHGFWIRWYQAALDGRPLTGDWDSHWQMLHDIAVIPDDAWDQGAEHIAALIAEIEQEYTYKVSDDTRVSAELLLRSALGRFGFNDLRNLMELLPFADDLKTLSDADGIERFVRDMDQHRHEIETFLRAIALEGRALQGAGGIQIYFNEILDEAAKARQLSTLNIGWIVDCGEILQGYSTNQETLAELGPLSIPFRRTLQNLLDLTRRNFSATILRLATLRDIRSSEETDLGDLMQDLRRGFEQIRDEVAGDRVAMAPEALAVFEKLLEETNRLIQREFITTDPTLKSNLRKDIDYRMAQISVSLRLYLEQASQPGKAVKDVVQGVAKKKAGQGVEGLVDWVLGWLKNGGHSS